MLDVGRRTWKERHGDTVILQFSLTSLHLGWHGIVHGGITCGMFDDIFAQYCRAETPGLYPLTKMLQIDFVKPVIPDESLFARVSKTPPPPGRDHRGNTGRAHTMGADDSGKRRQRIWVQGHIETVRDNEVVTLAKAEALFILCEKLPKPPKPTPPRQARVFTQMSQELWDIVLEHLPSLNGRHAALAFDFELTERHRKHSDIWHKIFKNGDSWTAIASRQGLNLSLIGYDLCNLYHDPMQPAYIVLSTGDKSGNIRHDKARLLKSLRAHHLNEKNEVVFDESNITLNIDGALHNPFCITSSPRELFSSQDGQLRSASLYWKDSRYALREIGPEDIVGIGKRATTLEDVSFICGITLTHPKEMSLRQRHQQCFQHPECPPAYPICPVGYVYNGDNIIGWEWDNQL